MASEEDVCFRLIRSAVESQRIEGYRRHIAFLVQTHRITVHYCQRMEDCAANSSERYVKILPIDSEENAALAYHELAHILEGHRATDGRAVTREADATTRAMQLAPFSRQMHHLLGLCLWTYSLDPTASAHEKQRYKQINGTVTYAESKQRWMNFWDREDLVRRWQAEANQKSPAEKRMEARWKLVQQWKREAQRG